MRSGQKTVLVRGSRHWCSFYVQELVQFGVARMDQIAIFKDLLQCCRRYDLPFCAADS